MKYTYIDKDGPWLGILEATAFVIHSITNNLKGYTMNLLIFGHDMIIPIKYTADS